MSQSLPNHVPSCEKACVAIWFRSDLRTSDNQALWLACEAARPKICRCGVFILRLQRSGSSTLLVPCSWISSNAASINCNGRWHLWG